MAKIVQSLTQPPREYDQESFLSLVRDLNGLIEKLNTTFQEEKTEDNDAVVFFFRINMANVFVNKKVDLTTTDVTTLYTVPSATTAIVKSILVSDDSGSGSTITIQVVTPLEAIFSVAHQKTISANTPTEILTHPLVVETGEIVKVTAGNANRLHVILSAMQVTPRTVVT